MTGTAAEFKTELAALLNKYNVDGRSQIPDYILADFIIGTIQNVAAMAYARDNWFGIQEPPKPNRVK